MFDPFASRPPRIIVSDDHEWIRHILMEVVHQTLPDAEVIETTDGLQALEAYHQGGCQFLVTNHAMPGLDGVSLIRQLRQEGSEVPIVMVSVKPEMRVPAITAGANWFISKEQIMEYLPPLLLGHAGRRMESAGGAKPGDDAGDARHLNSR